MKTMLAQYSAALPRLHAAIGHPDVQVDPVPYGDALSDADHGEIPAGRPAGGDPSWMRSLEEWAKRDGPDAETKRATLRRPGAGRPAPWR